MKNPVTIDVCAVGMTKRELFAMAAMQGLLAESQIHGGYSNIALASVACADLLIEALNKKEEK